MFLKTFKVYKTCMTYCTQPFQTIDKFAGYIPIKALDIKYSHSSGPGGQNINARKTKVEIKFELEKASWIPNNIKEKIRERNLNKINSEGHLIIKSDKTRYQFLNQADCFDKLRNLIWKAQNDESLPTNPDDEELYKQRQELAARERLKLKRERSLDKLFRRTNDLV